MLLSFSELDVLIYQGKVGGLFRERKNERVATDIDSRNKSSSSSHEYDSVLSFQFICDNGKEINVNLTNWNINIFPGHASTSTPPASGSLTQICSFKRS